MNKFYRIVSITYFWILILTAICAFVCVLCGYTHQIASVIISIILAAIFYQEYKNESKTVKTRVKQDSAVNEANEICPSCNKYSKPKSKYFFISRKLAVVTGKEYGLYLDAPRFWDAKLIKKIDIAEWSKEGGDQGMGLICSQCAMNALNLRLTRDTTFTEMI